MLTEQDYDNAVQYLARLERKKALFLASLHNLTHGELVSARDFDICLKQVTEAWDEMFYDTVAATRHLLDAYERQDTQAMRRELSTQFPLAGKA